MNKTTKQLIRKLRNPKLLLGSVMPALIFAVVVGAIGVHFLDNSHAATPCTVSSNLVNSCHPLLGSYAQGYNLGSGFANTGPSVAQTQAAEKRAGRNFDVIHSDYHRGAGGDTLTSEEVYFATKTNQTVFLNWWPTKNWAQGDTSAIYPEVDAMATSIKNAEKVAPFKVMITLQHEMNDKVSKLDTPNDSTCPSNVRLPGSSGTPAQYRNMVINVENRFKADGVDSSSSTQYVVWALLFESFNQGNDNAFPNCLDQALYPGNQYVNWVGYDTYGNGSTAASNSSTGGAFQQTAGKTYQFLESLSSNPKLTTYGMLADNRPLVLGEFGSCRSGFTSQENADYFNDAKYALDHHLYPDIQLYMVFDAPGTGNSAPGGCMLGYTNSGQPVAGNIVQNAFNSFANDPLFKATSTTSTHTSVTLTSPSDGSTVSGTVNLAATATAGASLSIKSVAFKLTDGNTTTDLKTDTASPYTYSWNSAAVANSSYTITAVATDSGGNTTQSAVTVTVTNKTSTHAPSVTGISPSSGSMAGGSSVTVTGANFQAGDKVSIGGTAATDIKVNSSTSISATTPSHAKGTVTVAVSDESGQSGSLTNGYTFLDQTPPSQPTNLASPSQTASSISLTWKASTDNVGVTGYKVMNDGNEVGTTTKTSYTDSANLSPKTNYSFTVIAYDAAGNDSLPSAALVVATKPSKDTTPPTAPTNVKAVAVSPTQVNLSWTASTDNVGVAGYIVERSDGGSLVVIAKTTTSSPSYVDMAVLPNMHYSYVIEAYDAAGNISTPSTAATVTTPKTPDTTPPTAPTNVKAVAVSPTQVNLSWTASTDNVGVAGYIVERDGKEVANVSTTNFGDDTVAPNTTYSYTVIAYDAANNKSQPSSPPAVVTTGSTTSYTGPGLTATYFDNMNLAYDSKTVTEVDPDINYNWGSQAPQSGFPQTDWSVRWTGRVVAPTTGTYTFYVNTDDGARLWIGGQGLVNDWHDHSAGHVKSATIHLVAGQSYDLQMDYYENKGVASAQLEWLVPGTAAKIIQVVPTAQLLSSSYGLLGTYYNNMTLTSNSATYSEIDADVNFNWGSKPPKTGFPSTHWSASWSGEIIPPTTGTYSFYVNTDDGSRLILNGQELINDWHDHSAGHVKSATIHLTGGQPYRIKMQYYQDKGVASAQLEYSGPAIPVMTIPTQVMLDK